MVGFFRVLLEWKKGSSQKDHSVECHQIEVPESTLLLRKFESTKGLSRPAIPGYRMQPLNMT